MAQETRLAISAPPGSQALLDALLQNLYDFGETEDETEEKRVRKKREKKRGTGTLASLATEPAPQPESLVRGQRKSAASFFQELQEELQGAPAVTPSGSPAGPVVSGAAAARSPLRNDREPVEVVQFHSRSKKRKQNPDQEENAKSILHVSSCCRLLSEVLLRTQEVLGSSLGSAPVWDHRLWERKGESPGTGTCHYAGCSASQKELCELQGFAGTHQRKEGSEGRRKENGQGHRYFQEKEEERAGRQEIKKEEVCSKYFVKWTDWTGWKIQKWDIDFEPN
uniref:Uncharacterized protein n=1 Tax=Capra hircus TaxID=9925 RepID=A0A8C2SJR6_CAPHI